MSDNLDNNMPAIEVFPPPELHLLISPVNALFDGLEKVWPQSEDWLKLCNVKKVQYHEVSSQVSLCKCLQGLE